MKPKPILLLIVLCVVVALGALPSARSEAATVVNGYDLSWWSVDGGGATGGSSGLYALGATLGQHDARVWAGGDYSLAGGFWPGAPVEYRTWMPLLLRDV
jgi:hypothetical protein